MVEDRFQVSKLRSSLKTRRKSTCLFLLLIETSSNPNPATITIPILAVANLTFWDSEPLSCDPRQKQADTTKFADTPLRED